MGTHTNLNTYLSYGDCTITAQHIDHIWYKNRDKVYTATDTIQGVTNGSNQTGTHQLLR